VVKVIKISSLKENHLPIIFKKLFVMDNIEKLGFDNWFKNNIDLAISTMVRQQRTLESTTY